MTYDGKNGNGYQPKLNPQEKRKPNPPNENSYRDQAQRAIRRLREEQESAQAIRNAQRLAAWQVRRAERAVDDPIALPQRGGLHDAVALFRLRYQARNQRAIYRKFLRDGRPLAAFAIGARHNVTVCQYNSHRPRWSRPLAMINLEAIR